MYERIAEPTAVIEIVGGRYDGDFEVRATCPGCGSRVVHILTAEEYGPSHRVADCGNGCQGGYDVVRHQPGLLGLPWRWWDPQPSPLNIGESSLPLWLRRAGVEEPTGPGLLSVLTGEGADHA